VVCVCVVCGVWCVVSGVWCVVCGVWCVVCGVWCVVCGVWCGGGIVRGRVRLARNGAGSTKREIGSQTVRECWSFRVSVRLSACDELHLMLLSSSACRSDVLQESL
jgi:hypothetical protein